MTILWSQPHRDQEARDALDDHGLVDADLGRPKDHQAQADEALMPS
ncbi:hypothetical protein [Mycolicibacterium gadium]|uniref:Uncharacterized protein n=1 Tax=Mycolicibacterium gadium TaxID=1794 RepID=A0ABT6GQ59_MYCGU|nr:hypothetical protein [Mycolicibacterium gadium]MDG5483343.1 hypothetical protein [Mycolicibacterium gadium]